MDMQNPPIQYTNGARGFSKLFHIETMRRIPCIVSGEAQQAIIETNYEGRQFPQALSDMFGAILEVERIEIFLVKKKDHFGASENDEDDLLYIHVVRSTGQTKIFFLNMDDLRQFHRSGWHAFQAGATAQELVRLYKLEYQ